MHERATSVRRRPARDPLSVPDGSTEVWCASIVATARADVERDGTDEFIVKAECAWKAALNVFALRPDGNDGWAALGLVVGESAEIGWSATWRDQHG